MPFKQSLGAFALPIIHVFALSACENVSEYTSSNAGQEFSTFSPGTVSLPSVASSDAGSSTTTSGDSSGSSGGGGSTASNDTQDQSGGSTSTSIGSPPSTTSTPTIETPETPERVSAPSLSTTPIVWKPVSEGDGRLVILLPTSFGSPSVTILDAGGGTVEGGRYVGRTNGNRATYRFSRPGRGYSAPSLLRVGSQTYSVSSPASRYN